MKRDDIRIPEPCHASWDEMRQEEGDHRRFCDHCTKHVHDLSALTERQARALLDSSFRDGVSICVSYACGPGGEVRFAPEPTVPPAPQHQLLGLKRMVAAAALAVPMLAAGCTGEATPEEHEAPIVMVEEEGGVLVQIRDEVIDLAETLRRWATGAGPPSSGCEVTDEVVVTMGEPMPLEVVPEPTPEPAPEVEPDLLPTERVMGDVDAPLPPRVMGQAVAQPTPPAPGEVEAPPEGEEVEQAPVVREPLRRKGRVAPPAHRVISR